MRRSVKSTVGCQPKHERHCNASQWASLWHEASNVALKPGTHLVREWNGRTYQIEVTRDGYRMDGRTWASLSAIAKHITGTSWSGPRFFGLTGPAKESA